jgi:UDP-glucose 6-dehydrogenase
MDVQYLAYLAGNRAFECHSKLFKNTIETNKRFKELVVKKMIRSLTSLQDTTIVVMGFSCKPNTSNIWDSPALYICENWWWKVQGFGFMILEILHQVIKKCFRPGLKTSIRVIQQLDIDTLWNQSHAILFLQRWEEFNHIDFRDVYEGMVKSAYIFYACNCNLEYGVMRGMGFQIHSMMLKTNMIWNWK